MSCCKAKGWVFALLLTGLLATLASAMGKLPEGPIHDRHELMEAMGKHAKKIGEAVKADKKDVVAENAQAIHVQSQKIPALFPKGSTHPESRAKEEIWKNWSGFEAKAHTLTEKSGALVEAAHSGENMAAPFKQMAATCKSCHDEFRAPED